MVESGSENVNSGAQTAATDAKQIVAGGAACPACAGRELETFFEVPELPVSSIVLWPSRETALACPKGRIELAFCQRCGAISNLAFDSTRLTYDPAYDNSLHFSPTFQRYAEGVARDLVDRYNLRGKDIIDVGCGNGEFLALLCALGDNRGVGFDPSFIPGRSNLAAGKGISIIPDYYSGKYADHAADLVICRHVLEHISRPQELLRNVRAALTAKPDAIIFFELPNASFVFSNKGIWDIIYEHCFYYSSNALSALFVNCGFDVLNVSETFQGQYLCLEARLASRQMDVPANAGPEPGSMREYIARFADEYRSWRTYWKESLARFAEQGKRIMLWGAGAKGAIFLNTFRESAGLDYIVDINPNKWGSHIPGTGQEIVSPEFLKEYRPDVLLIVNSNYQEEISRQVSALGLAPEFLAI